MVETKLVFPQSRELKKIIGSHDWTLYDMYTTDESVYTWEEIEKKAPAEQYEIGHNYLFVPIPKNNRTLKEEYALTKGLGPSLTIGNTKDERWLFLEVQIKDNGNIALFSRLFFGEDCVLGFSPETDYLPNPDIVGIKYDKLVDTFENYFRIVLPEEYGLTAPI